MPENLKTTLILLAILVAILLIRRIADRIQDGKKEKRETQRELDQAERLYVAQKHGENPVPDGITEDCDDADFSLGFFEGTQMGKKHQVFVRTSSPQDAGMIQSLLYSSGISSYSQFEHVTGVFGNTEGMSDSLFASKIQILEEQYDDAFQILVDYIGKKADMAIKKAGSSESLAWQGVYDLLRSGQVLEKKHEIFGITVYPKMPRNPIS